MRPYEENRHSKEPDEKVHVGFWKSVTKKAVKEATDAVVEEVKEKVEVGSKKYLPIAGLVIAGCVGLSILMRSPRPAPKPETVVKVFLVMPGSRGIRSL